MRAATQDVCGHPCQQQVDASGISTRPVKTINETYLDGVRTLHKNDRDCLGRRFGCERAICALKHDNQGYLTADQFDGQRS